MKAIRTPARFVLGAVVLVLTTHVLTARLTAQETRGKITGRIADTSKAILPGATVTVTDVARNTVATATSNEQGLFQVNYLLPGTYKVVIEMSGFKTSVRENVVLEIAQTLNLDITLDLGRVPDRVGREPVRGTAAGNEPEQHHDRPSAVAAPVPRVRGHQHDE